MKVLPICPSHLSDVTTLLWEIQKVIFNSVIHAYFWLFTLFQKKTNCNPLAHPIWKCHHTNLWIAKLFHPDWRFAAYFQTLEALKRASCGLSSVVMWLATEMLGKQCHSNCSEWPPSALIHASGLFRHWSVALVHHVVLKFSPRRNKPLPQASTRPYQYTRSSCSVPQTQY